MRRVLAIAAITAILGGSALGGCNGGTDYDGIHLGDPNATREGGTVPSSTAPTSSNCGPAQPAPQIEKADPATLPACAPACGGAHCVPGDKVPAVSRSSFATCSGGFCIPDTLIRSGGAKPATCKSLNGAAGVCLSVCVPQVAEHADALPQANCAGDERCAPCINPNDNTSTGACLIGEPLPAVACVDGGSSNPDAPVDPGNPDGAPLPCPHTGPPVLDPAQLPACGGSGSAAHCLAASLTPSAMKGRLDTCPSGGYCVPDKLIATGGRFIPATCTSTGGAEGRCLGRVIKDVGEQENLPIGGCDESERCVPCYNPIDGADTGACKTSCDPGPKDPPVLFQDCCSQSGEPQGKCVPSSSVPASFRTYLQTDSCSGGSTLCAPTENIMPGFQPQQCSAFSLFLGQYNGVCLSNCVTYGSNDFAVAAGDCDGLHRCAPCKDQNGQPTGAPGCQ